MDKIKKFFECLIPETVCNLKCDYCYVIQRNQATQKVPELDYSPEVIGKALSQKRLGGVCYFSICGAGETFIPDYLIDIIYHLLKNGHYVNVTTNGTLTKKIRRLSEIPCEWLPRLHVAFSLHYLELKKKSMLDSFFENVNYVRKLGCSVMVQLNLYDGYIPYLDEISNICMEKVQALPQLVATRKEESILKKIELMSEYTENEYKNIGRKFDSPLFDFTMKNFNQKRIEFCYAGSWSYTLNLKTGILKRCYASGIYQNIFKDIDKPLMDLPVGNCCGSLYCLNSSHFMSLGVLPSIETPSYASLRNREEAYWYSDVMKEFLSGKLKDSNTECKRIKKICVNIIGWFDWVVYRLYQAIKKFNKGEI